MEIKYKIKVAQITKTKYFLVECNEKPILENFTSHDWTSSEAQEIIDGVETSKTKPKEEPFERANEDVELNANENGVWLYDWLADRAGVDDPKKLNLYLSHDEFITFMKDFKSFIEKNS